MKKQLSPIWWIVLAAGTILAINMGIRQTFGLFLPPMTQDLQIGREVFSLAIALLNLLWGAGAPFAGALSDKFGARWVVFGGTAFYVGGLIIMATSSGEGGLLLSGVLIGLGVAGTGFTAVFGVIGRAAPPEKRAAALSLASMGSAVGQFAALPYTHVLLGETGWVMTLFLLAGTAAVMAPLGFAMASGVRSDANPAASGGKLLPDEQTMREALREAFRHPGFILLTLGFYVCGFQLAAVVTHLPAFLVDRHFDPSLGVFALTAVGLTNIAGTYLWGRAGEMITKRLALTVIYLGRGVVFLGLLYLPLSETTVILAVGGFMGAWLGGWLYDSYQSYDMLWWATIAVSLMAALCHLPIKERPAPRLTGVPAE